MVFIYTWKIISFPEVNYLIISRTHKQFEKGEIIRMWVWDVLIVIGEATKQNKALNLAAVMKGLALW
jgi:hypothetical protein